MNLNEWMTKAEADSQARISFLDGVEVGKKYARLQIAVVFVAAMLGILFAAFTACANADEYESQDDYCMDCQLDEDGPDQDKQYDEDDQMYDEGDDFENEEDGE